MRELIHERLMKRLFGHRVLQNDARGDWVEEMVALALEPDWRLCAGDWASWDFEHEASGVTMQVKQSAAKQSWSGPPYAGKFSIKPGTGFWEDGTRWVPFAGRIAQLYLFAWHPRFDGMADHRDPEQWRFFVVRERELPAGQKSISRTVVEHGWPCVSYAELAEAVEMGHQAVVAFRAA